jgi:hypothetical protein
MHLHRDGPSCIVSLVGSVPRGLREFAKSLIVLWPRLNDHGPPAFNKDGLKLHMLGWSQWCPFLENRGLRVPSVGDTRVLHAPGAPDELRPDNMKKREAAIPGAIMSV